MYKINSKETKDPERQSFLKYITNRFPVSKKLINKIKYITKSKSNKEDFIKIKNFWVPEDTIKKVKKVFRMEENVYKSCV